MRLLHRACTGAVQEAVSSEDVGEARLCLRSLAVPFFHHQLVKQALLMAMENATAAEPLLELLKSLAGSGDISPLQMQKVSYFPLYLEFGIRNQ